MMNHYSWVKRVDRLLILCLTIGLVLILGLSLYGELFSQKAGDTSVACGTVDIQKRISTLLRTKKRLIAVVGDGVPSESIVLNRPYNTQFAQGYDLFQGVRHAVNTQISEPILDSVGILYLDDGGNPECASQIAGILSGQPSLLGVIGHSTTSCTKEALSIYQKYNIPIIIPAATNPDLLLENHKNTFRLPSNDNIQGLVISDVIINKLKGADVFIVWDATPEALEYSEYLKNAIQKYLGAVGHDSVMIEGSYPISLNPMNYAYLFKRIVSSQPDVIVFTGYGSLAREFLLGLDSEYKLYNEITRPKIILSDGCKIPGITNYGFDTYLTFAADRISEFDVFKNYDPGVRMPRYRKMYLEESFEIFGYDAAIIFLSSIIQLSSVDFEVSRSSIAETIMRDVKTYSTCYPYNFENGENTNDRYFCYSVNKDSVIFHYDQSAISGIKQSVLR